MRTLRTEGGCGVANGRTNGSLTAIVQAVVAAHGGTVRVDSVPGRTSFTVWLPADRPAVDPRPAVLAVPAPRH